MVYSDNKTARYLFEQMMSDQLLTSTETNRMEARFLTSLPTCMKEDNDPGTLKEKYIDLYTELIEAIQYDAFFLGFRVGRDLKEV